MTSQKTIPGKIRAAFPDIDCTFQCAVVIGNRYIIRRDGDFVGVITHDRTDDTWTAESGGTTIIGLPGPIDAVLVVMDLVAA